MFHAHSWLAGLYTKHREPEQAALHLTKALKILNRKKLRPQRHVLVKQLLRLVEGQFPALAGDRRIQKLQEEASEIEI